MDGGMNWRSAFERYQDFGASLIFISGNIQFTNNIITSKFFRNSYNQLFNIYSYNRKFCYRLCRSICNLNCEWREYLYMDSCNWSEYHIRSNCNCNPIRYNYLHSYWSW